jgi:transcriptional regulator with XRE-family HTH domain
LIGGGINLKCIISIRQEQILEVDGAQIRVARAEKGWTITKLSEVSGVTRKTIGEIEKGKKKKIRYATIVQLADSLEKNVINFGVKNGVEVVESNEFSY